MDSAHHFPSPSLSWDALLKKTGVELELLRDQDINLFIQRGMRDGIFIFIFIKGGKNYITYLEANNLRLQVEARDAHGRADHKNKRAFQEGVDTRAGPRA